MDIALLSKDTLKIKIKKISVIVDPSKETPKTDADAIIVLSENPDKSRVNEYRVAINGAGEYEVGGLKISAFRATTDLIFSFSLENCEAILVKASSLSKISTDKIKDYSIVVVNADSEINQSVITSMEPRIIIIYGQKAVEAAKALGKENLVKSSKISINEDKLPEETEIYLLS